MTTPAQIQERVMAAMEFDGMESPQAVYDHLKRLSTENVTTVAKLPVQEIPTAIKKWLKQQPLGQ
eukprot:8857433-Pyramimonas_sp.AAC.1